ncbi:MAG: ATPase [Paenibacillus sp.]|jgi:primosomal protein DnaI|nr:ATPase [Paenibacillus sp.]
MESISEMLGAYRKSFGAKADQKIRQLLEHPLVQKLRADHPELDDHAIKVNMNRIYQYVTDHGNCTNCPGLALCPNDFEGHYTMLSVESIGETTYIHDRKVMCRKQLAKQSQDAIRSRIRSFYIDDTALSQGYSTDEIVDIDPERVEAVGSILRYIRRTQASGLQKEGLYLVGPFGTGKTFLMCYMLYQLAKSGHSGAIVYVPDFMEDLKSMFSDPQRMKETIELLKETDLLVFDDIGAENLNPWLRDHVMGTILNYRMNRKPTFFTSNHEPDELEKHFSFTSKDGDEEFKGQRIMDRIRPFVEVVVVNGTNKRGRARE